MSTRGHRLFPHGEIKTLADGLWQVRGSLPLPLPRNMTIYRLSDGRLLLYSVVALNDDGMRTLEQLGEPAVMVVPHVGHLMDAAFYKERYPKLQVVAHKPPARRLEKEYAGRVPVDSTPDEALPALGIRFRYAPGMKWACTELNLDLDIDNGRALLFTDIFTATPPKKIGERLLVAPKGGIGLARVVRFRQVEDRGAVRSYFTELSELPNLRWLLTCHGKPISEDCAGVLQHAARFA